MKLNTAWADSESVLSGVSNQLISLASREGTEYDGRDKPIYEGVSNQLISLASREESFVCSIFTKWN
jgi:hypothetical protein